MKSAYSTAEGERKAMGSPVPGNGSWLRRVSSLIGQNRRSTVGANSYAVAKRLMGLRRPLLSRFSSSSGRGVAKSFAAETAALPGTELCSVRFAKNATSVHQQSTLNHQLRRLFTSFRQPSENGTRETENGGFCSVRFAGFRITNLTHCLALCSRLRQAWGIRKDTFAIELPRPARHTDFVQFVLS